jgi:hypothetical protein
MAKTIITQDGDLVNYANVIAVSVEMMSVEDEEYTPDDSYVLLAHDITNSVIALGYYPNYESACEAEESIVNWLDGETLGVCRLNDERVN